MGTLNVDKQNYIKRIPNNIPSSSLSLDRAQSINY